MIEQWDRVRPWFGTVARLVVGIAWIWLSISRIHDPTAFTERVRAYDMSPEWLSKGVGYGAPVLVVCLGALLVVGAVVRLAAAASAVCALVALIAQIEAAARGLSLSFGGSTSYGSSAVLFAVLLVLSAFLAVWPFTRISWDEFLARHDYVPPPSAKRLRTAEGRREYESKLASVAKRARSRNLYLTSSVAIIVVLLAIIGVGVQATRANPKVTSSPTLASQSSGVTWGKKAAATVRIYEDFGCTGCRTFWNSVRARLETSVRANQAQLQIVPMAVTASSNDYPMRAASAAICASDAGGDQFLALHDHLFGTFQKAVVQPAAGAAGPSNYKLQLLGRAAGLSTSDFQTYSTCVQSEKYKTFVQALTNSASQRGVSSLPAVYVNGKAVAANAGAVFAAIKSANVGVTPHPSPTPTPTPSSSASSSASASASPSSASASPSAPGSAKRSGSASPSKSAGKSSAG